MGDFEVAHPFRLDQPVVVVPADVVGARRLTMDRLKHKEEKRSKDIKEVKASRAVPW